jgi:hypothetical protein
MVQQCVVVDFGAVQRFGWQLMVRALADATIRHLSTAALGGECVLKAL